MTAYSGYGPNRVAGEDQAAAGRSGLSVPGDTTNEPGQYPQSLFGVGLPQGTGAPGSQGARFSAGVDPTNEPGQLNEGISGLGPADIADTGSPGSQGSVNDLTTGGDTVSFTKPSGGLVTYETMTVQADVSGPRDWTAANEQGYASGGPQLPGLKGNEPSVNDGPFTAKAGGRVMRGGRGRS